MLIDSWTKAVQVAKSNCEKARKELANLYAEIDSAKNTIRDQRKGNTEVEHNKRTKESILEGVLVQLDSLNTQLKSKHYNFHNITDKQKGIIGELEKDIEEKVKIVSEKEYEEAKLKRTKDKNTKAKKELNETQAKCRGEHDKLNLREKELEKQKNIIDKKGKELQEKEEKQDKYHKLLEDKNKKLKKAENILRTVSKRLKFDFDKLCDLTQ